MWGRKTLEDLGIRLDAKLGWFHLTLGTEWQELINEVTFESIVPSLKNHVQSNQAAFRVSLLPIEDVEEKWPCSAASNWPVLDSARSL